MDGHELDEALALLARARTPYELFGGAAGGPPAAPAGGGYAFGAEVARGDLANLYAAEHGGPEPLLLKAPRDPADSDLIDREAVALRQLVQDGDARFLPYVPRLVETFHDHGDGGEPRRVNVLRRLDGFHSLAEVRAAYPDGLDPRDVAWMWRRLLVALGFAHRAMVVHGAVLPEHVLIHPEQHGLVLVDWCYSVPGCYAGVDPSGLVPAMVDRYAEWYPEEVPGRRPASPATDIHMATLCMTYLLPDEIPTPLWLFVRGCTLAAQRSRPYDAWGLLAELDGILAELYGPRRFRPFHLPPAVPHDLTHDATTKENPHG